MKRFALSEKERFWENYQWIQNPVIILNAISSSIMISQKS